MSRGNYPFPLLLGSAVNHPPWVSDHFPPSFDLICLLKHKLLTLRRITTGLQVLLPLHLTPNSYNALSGPSMISMKLNATHTTTMQLAQLTQCKQLKQLTQLTYQTWLLRTISLVSLFFHPAPRLICFQYKIGTNLINMRYVIVLFTETVQRVLVYTTCI